MHRAISLLAVTLLAPVALPAQGGAFIARLGADTLSVERYTRTATLIEGEQVVRSPTSEHRIYRATLAPDGSVKSFEYIRHNISGAPGPAETRSTIEFRGDSAIVRTPRGDSTVTIQIATGPGAVPQVLGCYGLVEYFAQRARAAGGDRFTATGVPTGGGQPVTITVARVRPDSTTIQFGPIGPLAFRLDEGGRLAWLSGRGSTMQVDVERVATLDLAALGRSFSTRPLGPLSPADSVKATIAGTSLTVRYARPGMRGRTIFGGVVPWNRVWRTGANSATIFETSADLTIGGTTIPAGKYTLWTIPTATGWTLIVNKNTGQWGTEYDAKHDLARLAMEVGKLERPVEQFTIAIAPQGAGGVLTLEWETTRASIAFSR